MIRLENGCQVIGAVKETRGEGYIVLAWGSNNEMVCWRTDGKIPANCFWGRYADEAIPAFIERVQRHVF